MPLHESNCPLLCVFYAEFDNVVGPIVRCQSPMGFMDLLIGTDYEKIEAMLKATFVSVNTGDSNNSIQNLNQDPKNLDDVKDEKDTNIDDKNQSQKVKKTSMEKSGEGFSIFDSISDFIITGNELADKVISIETHNLRVLSRPTIISNELYERNLFLSSVGFVLRKDCDAKPYYPVLTKLSSLLRTMEIESQYLSKLGGKRGNDQNANTDSLSLGRLQNMNIQHNQKPNQSCSRLNNVLRSILINLNSQNAECNLILNEANALNLKLFKPSKPIVDPVPDYAVPILLRPEWQLQMFDLDLTVNWIVPKIDGLKYTRQLSQSPEVDMDMEMVKACLRVLKHHELIAFVDIFKYSNVYEATPLAISILSNTDTSSSKYSLLLEAFDFAVKVNKKDALPNNNNPCNINNSTFIHAHASPSNSTFKPSSVQNESPDRDHHLRKHPNTNMQSQLHSNDSSENTILSSAVSASAKKKELNLMRAALSQFYCSFHRNMSLKDIILSKVSSNNNKGNQYRISPLESSLFVSTFIFKHRISPHAYIHRNPTCFIIAERIKRWRKKFSYCAKRGR